MDDTRDTGMELNPKFDDNGLLTAVVTDVADGTVLMVGHMNAPASRPEQGAVPLGGTKRSLGRGSTPRALSYSQGRPEPTAKDGGSRPWLGRNASTRLRPASILQRARARPPRV